MQSARKIAYDKEYRARPEVKAAKAAYNATPEMRAARSAYGASTAGRSADKKYHQRLDRPCRYAQAGCLEFAIVDSAMCRKHHNEAVNNKQIRRRAKLDLKLAESQQWVCPWCLKDLPTDLRHVHLDHVIPVSLGGPDIEWNLQVLHASCNESKKDRITSRAVELATEHGMIDCFTWTTEN